MVRGVASKNCREEAGSDLNNEKPLIRSWLLISKKIKSSYLEKEKGSPPLAASQTVLCFCRTYCSTGSLLKTKTSLLAEIFDEMPDCRQFCFRVVVVLLSVIQNC